MADETRETAPKKSTERKAQKVPSGNAGWFVPVMVTLMVVGLLWIVVFYITNQQYPVPSLRNWNLGVGFGLMMAGFLMTTRWK